MRIKFAILAIFLLLTIDPVLAGDPPILLAPENNSIVTSSKLEWKTPSYELYSSNPYRVQVDDDSSFSPTNSIYRDTYKTNTVYTPQLTDGVWYWRIKAKDASGTWSDWSNSRTFTLSTTTPPASTPTPATTPTPSSTSTPTSPLSTPSTSTLFEILNPPSQINSNQSFNINVSLSLPNNPSNIFYLKAAFKKFDGSNYFGFTKVSGSWVKNSSGYSSQYQITTNSLGNWSGNLEVLPDNEDSGFTGSGEYMFKVAKYTSSGSGPTWSNEAIINILESKENNNQNPTSEEVSTNNFSSSPTPISQSKSIANSTTQSSSKPPPVNITYKIASVAGATASASPEIETIVKNKKPINPFNIVGISLIFVGIGSLGYIYWKKR